ncbi:MAG: DUF6020 family protein [Lachnospiraceae bacterium]|nr:DUF6020 family protein [Lachnospiraceae bacterium]
MSISKKEKIIWTGVILCFSIVNALGHTYESTASRNGVLLFLLWFAASFVIVGVLSVLGARGLGLLSNRSSQSTDYSLKKLGLMVGLLLVVYGVVLLCCYPGVITWDTRDQIWQVLGKEEMDNHHPLFLTYVIGVFIRFGRHINNFGLGLFFFEIVQVICAVMAEMYSVWIVNKSTKNTGISNCLYIFWLLNPIVIIYTITVGKDTSFAICLLFFISSLAEAMLIRKSINKRLFIQIVLSPILTGLVRHNGVYVIILSLIFLIMAKREFRKSFVLIFASFLLLLGLRNVVYYHIVGVAPPEDAEKYSIVFQTTARVLEDHEEELSLEQVGIIENVLGDISLVKENYDPQLSDPVKDLYNAELNSTDKRRFFKQWVALFFKYPGSYISATYDQTYGYFYPDYSNNVKCFFRLSSDARLLETVKIGLKFPNIVARINDAVEMIRTAPILRYFMSMATYNWILICVFIGALIKKDGDKILLALPLLGTLATILLSPVNGYLRYMYPIIYCVPFVLLVSAADSSNHISS